MRSIVLLAVAVLIQPIGSAWAQGAVAPPPPWEPAGSAGAIPADVPRPGATPIVRIPLAPAPVAGPFDARAGPPAVRPNLPVGTPDEQRHADPSAPITDLRAAIERAYWTNPELIAERARLRGADFRLPQARGEYGLQLQYSASYDYRRESFEQAVGQIATRTGWTGTAGAVLAQPLFTFGRLRAGEDAARGEIAFARASLENVEQQTLFDTIAAYAAVLRDRAGVGIAGDNVALLEREFGDTRERFGARESTVTDLQQVRSRLELARAQLLTAQATAASSDARFLRVVGAPAGDLRQPPPLTIPARTLEDAYAQADAGNPVLAAAYSRERISRAAVEAARAERFPRVGVEGRASTGSSRALGAELRQTDLRGALTITGTLDAGIVRARLGQASEANDADWRLIDAALRDSRAELAEAWNESQAQAAGIERLAEAVEASRQAMEGALLQERAGLRTTLDVLELARDLLQVRTSYNATTAASFVARARVLAAMGSLDLEFLLPEAAGYRPQEHLRTVEGSADLPLVTPVVRALDSLLTPPRRDRAVRDPAAPLAVRAARAAQDQADP